MRTAVGALDRLWQLLGFLLSYAIFTTMLYFILLLLGKLSSSWSVISVAILTACIVAAGLMLERVLK